MGICSAFIVIRQEQGGIHLIVFACNKKNCKGEKTMKKNLVKLFALVLSVSMVLACLSLSVGATEDTLQITVGQAQGGKGETVNVPLTITANPGVSSLTLSVSYGSELTLTSVTDGGILGTYESDDENYASPFILSWSNDTAAANITATGKLATLTFTVASDAAIGEKPITVTCDAEMDGALDFDMDPVATSITNGSINVIEETFVDGGECGANATWALYESGKFVVRGTGAMTNYKSSARPWYKKVAQIQSVEICDGITGIGTYAFASATNLKSVVMADSVKKINTAAFYGCKSLTDIRFSEALTEIGGFAFYSCSALEQITIPDSVRNIGDEAFEYCRRLKSIEIPEGVQDIKIAAFLGCTSLEKVVLPTTLTSIGRQAFYDCGALKSIILPENLETLGDFVFYNCESLNDIRITAATVGSYVFSKDGPKTANLAYITFTNRLTSIGTNAFNGSKSITAIYFEGTENEWSNVNKAGGNGVIFQPSFVVDQGMCNQDISWALYANGSLNINGKGLMPDYTQGTAPWAAYADQITKANIFGEVESIGAYAFDGCTNLADAYFGKYVETIASNAFTNTAIDNVTINSTVTYIGENAFDDLDTVYFDQTSENAALYVEGAADVNAQNVHYALDNGYCGKTIRWTVYDDNKLVISGSGVIDEYYIPNPETGKNYHADKPWNAYLDSITSLVITSGITQIGSSAFRGLTALETVTLPPTLKTIRPYGFANCTALNTISIPEKVSTIGNYTFRGCTSLVSASLPTNVTSFGEGVFYGDTSLVSITLPERIKDIPMETFSGCTSLADVTLSTTLTSIGNSAFNGTAIKSIDLPNTVSSIGTGAFYGCAKLTSFRMPKKITAVSGEMFRNCSKLKTVYLPIAVTSIEAKAFQSSGVTTVYYEGSAEQWAQILANKGASNTKLDSAEAVTVTQSGDCGSSIKWLLFNNGDLHITGTGKMPEYNTKDNVAPWYAYNADITTITVNDGITQVGAYAFARLSYVTKAIIGKDVTVIRPAAFNRTPELADVELNCVGLSSIGDNAFLNAGTNVATMNIKFAGTAAQWANVKISDTGNTNFKAITPVFAG